MPRYAKVHHAVRAIYAKAEEAPQNQTNHLSGGMRFLGQWSSCSFFSDSQSREQITPATQTNPLLLTIHQKIKICIVGTLQQTKIAHFAQSHDSDSIACLSCYHKKIETVDRMKSLAQDMSASGARSKRWSLMLPSFTNMDCLEMEKHTRKSGGFPLALSQHATQKIPAIMVVNHG